jgi:hypothetical protein
LMGSILILGVERSLERIERTLQTLYWIKGLVFVKRIKLFFINFLKKFL